MHPSFHLYRLCSASRGFQRTLDVRFQSPTSSLCRSVVYLTSSPLSRTGNKPATTANNWRWTVMNSCPLWNTHRERWGRKTLYSNCRKWRNISLGTADNQDCPKVAHCTVQLPLRGRWVSTWLFFLKTASWEIRTNRLQTCWRVLISRNADVGNISLFLDQDLDCVTRQTDQTAPMCERDDLSRSQEAQVERRNW